MRCERRGENKFSLSVLIYRFYFIFTAWIEACGALMVIALIFSFVGTLLTAVGLCMKNHDTKFKLYRIAMYLMFLTRKYHKSVRL